MSLYKRNIRPAVIGASVIFTLVMMLGMVNVMIVSRSVGKSPMQFMASIAEGPGTEFYWLFSWLIMIACNFGGGRLAASLSPVQPYVNAAMASILYLAFTLFMTTWTGTNLVIPDTLTLVLFYVPPVPCAVLGAWWHLRRAAADA